jgi:hypothetical protein
MAAYPLQARTGSRGYFGNRGSVLESVQRTKVDPLADSTMRTRTQVEQSPEFGLRPPWLAGPSGFDLSETSAIEFAVNTNVRKRY